MMGSKKIGSAYRLVLTALFASIITVATAFLKINTGINEGYIHHGDCVLYLCASVLPFPYSFIAVTVGFGLADVLAGSVVWLPFTVIIKMLNTLPYSLLYSKDSKILCKRTVLLPVFSGAVTVFGYYIAECVLYSQSSANIGIIFNIIQATVNAVIFYLIAFSLDKTNFKSLIYK